MWKTIISGDKKKIFNSRIIEITKILETQLSYNNEVGLLSGNLGIAIYFFYYSLLTDNEKYSTIGLNILTNIFENLKKIKSNSFADGYSGIGWTIEHLVKEGFIDEEAVIFLNGFDIPLYNFMIEEIKEGHYDYLSGALGKGVYFISRLPKKEIANYLNQLLIGLKAKSITDINDSLKWNSIIKNDPNLIGVDLGLAHGLPSIIAFCTKLLETKMFENEVSKILKSAVSYVINQQEISELRFSKFPNFIEEGFHKDNSRLAWCYGDLGIGITLWRASKMLKDKDIELFSLSVLRDTVKRTDLKLNLVSDSILCHGTAGIAHIYNRMYQYTKNEEFKGAALYWFNETLKMGVSNDGHLDVYGNIVGNYFGLIDGIAGIGLSLISAISDIEPKWDECLLLS